MECPKCGSHDLQVDDHILGEHTCNDCGYLIHLPSRLSVEEADRYILEEYRSKKGKK